MSESSMIIDLFETYLAHFNSVTKEKQSVYEHDKGVSDLAAGLCGARGIEAIATLAAIFHDAGKYGDPFQEYMEKAVRDSGSVRRGEVNHATAGGLLMDELLRGKGVSEVLQTVVYSHHGLYDSVNMESGEPLLAKRHKQEYLDKHAIDLEMIRSRFYQFQDRSETEQLCREAQEQFTHIKKGILAFCKEHGAGNLYGNPDFYMGMYERLLLSLVMDGDRLDTAIFMGGRVRNDTECMESGGSFWNESIAACETYISNLRRQSSLNDYRKEISSLCKETAVKPYSLYRLTVPTGAGKTLSVLRFGLYHAREFTKKRIIYIAPYNSILEQNAQEIRSALGRADVVLEHHSNVLHETDEERVRYELLTENWGDSPIIVTTAVQLLNTLFSSGTGNVRRFHNLADSLIIFDEIQSLPVKTTCLFNMAVNYLITFLNTTVVLCSATQPVLDELPACRMLMPRDMIPGTQKYELVFRRTALIDCTGLKSGGMTVEELGTFAADTFQAEKQILIIVNTKKCALLVYQYLKEMQLPAQLFHLSTNMCAKNRQEILKQIKTLLNPKYMEPVICVSTALIEAGVDISFQCVIRSLTGLDSIIQAAGRCNRNREWDNANVYLVKMSEQAEQLSRLPDIRMAQSAMEDVLDKWRKLPEYDGNSLFSEEAKKQYYRSYYQKCAKDLTFPVTLSVGQTTLVDLLSSNEKAGEQLKRHKYNSNKWLLKQAFRTAGDLFQVISEDGKFDVIVEYDNHVLALLAQLEDKNCTYEKQRKILPQLQVYTVGIPEQLKNELGRAIHPICGGLVYSLDGRYYNKETGVLKDPVQMDFECF